jgi:hypothetical protein
MANKEHEKLRKFMPLDKCWTIRLGVLDILNGRQDHISNEISSWERLHGPKSITKDIKALHACARNWDEQSMVVQVSDCRTLYCFLKYASWKLKDMRSYMIGDDLLIRAPHADPKIVDWDQTKLMTLEGGSTCWASAKVLLGCTHRVFLPPRLLEMTYNAVCTWKASTKRGTGEYGLFGDMILFRQAAAFWDIIHKGKSLKVEDLLPDTQSRSSRPDPLPQDYFMLRTFGVINMVEGRKQFPELSYRRDRISDMEKQLGNLQMGKPIDTKDHRIIQAITMKSMYDGKAADIIHVDAVEKSWPAFWEFLQHVAS